MAGPVRDVRGVCAHRGITLTGGRIRDESRSGSVVPMGDITRWPATVVYSTANRTLAGHLHARNLAVDSWVPCTLLCWLPTVHCPIPIRSECLACDASTASDAWVDDILPGFLAETRPGNVECAVLHVRLLVVLLDVQPDVE